jgi:hypothetical protein
MPHRLPDDVAIAKIRESEDKQFVLRAYSAAKARLEEMDAADSAARKLKPGTFAEGSDVAANPGRSKGDARI